MGCIKHMWYICSIAYNQMKFKTKFAGIAQST